MKTYTVNVAFVLIALALGTASAAVNSALQEQAPGDIATLAVADFSALSSDSKIDPIPEKELSGGVEVGAAAEEPVMYGAYSLGPAEVDQITRILASELEMVPAADAVLATKVQFPGLEIFGSSVDVRSTAIPRPLRIPTIFAPQYSGYKFEIQGVTEPPGATLHFSNMTIVMPDAKYSAMATSGFMEYFDLGERARVCVANSMFVLGSCDGFGPEAFHMWCCNNARCIQYTENDLLDLGLPLLEPLEPLTCHSGNTAAAAASGNGSAASEAEDVEGRDVATEDIPATDQEAVGADSEPREVLTSADEANGGSAVVASFTVVVAALLMAGI